MQTRFSIGATETELLDPSEVDSFGVVRMKSSHPGLDAMFDGGIIPGFVYSLSGEAGSGKTTFSLMALQSYGTAGKKCGYVSGEESIGQLKDKTIRLQINQFKIAHSPVLTSILDMMEELDIIVIDSLQAIVIPGETKQTELKALNAIVAYAKEYQCAVILITHSTKDGKEKGNSSVLHIVDARIILRYGDDKAFITKEPRVFDVLKHRESNTGSIVFFMTEKGFDFNDPFQPWLSKNFGPQCYRKR